jgi:esterase
MQLYVKEVNHRQFQIADYPGEKGTIIAIHGLTGTHKNMHYYAELLTGEYRVIALDLRGRGNSSETDEEPSIFKHAQDIIDLIAELNIENPILMGHSMGAFISSIVASKLKSVKGLILLDGAASMSEHQRGIVKPSLGRLSKEYASQEKYVEKIKGIYDRLGITWTHVLQEAVEYEVEQVGDHWENKSTEANILADFDSFYTYNPKETCEKITCPALLVYAKGDIGSLPPLFYLSDYDETKKHLKDLDVFISDSNHYTMVFENRDDINQAVGAFLEKL